jgi:hypothetical protein
MDSPLVIVILVVAAVFLLFSFGRGCTKSNFQYLGTRSRGGDFEGEPNDECLYSPGYKFCQLTDGMPGVCVNNGICMPNMMEDPRIEWDEFAHPYCPMPIFKEGCDRFCRCKAMKGERTPGCVEECRSNYSSLNSI